MPLFSRLRVARRLLEHIAWTQAIWPSRSLDGYALFVPSAELDPRNQPAHPPGTTEPDDVIDRVIAEWARIWPELAVGPIAVISRLAIVRALVDQALDEVFAQYGLTGPSFHVLVVLRRRRPPYELTQRVLMTELGLTSGTISVRVDRLVAQGWVRRRPDPDDKRTTVVELTEAGAELCERVFPHHLANEERLLSALTPAEREQLAALLRKLLLSLQEDAGSGRTGRRLGVVLAPAHVARTMRRAVGLPDRVGLLVRAVDDGGPAQRAGLAEGDLLERAAGQELRSVTDLAPLLAGAGARSLTVDVVRGTTERSVTVELDPPEPVP